MDASELLIEKRHADMMTYARGALGQLPKRERVLADMIRTHMYTAWDLIGQQQWERDRRATLAKLDEELRRLKRLVRLARLYSHGQMTLDRIIPVIASHLGYLKHCRDGRGTEKFFQELVFRRSEMIIKNVKRRKTHERLRRTAASGTGTGTDSGASH